MQQGYLAKFFKNSAFLSCPAAADYKSFSSTTPTFATSPLTTYAYNGNAASVAALSSSARIKNASETCALIDGGTIPNDATGTVTGILYSYGPYFNSTTGQMNYNYPTFHGRHAGRGSVLWYDGHATTETPYITTLAANLQSGSGSATPAGMVTIRKVKLGYLTPTTATEDQLFANFTTANDLSYYYWADKIARQ